MSGEWKIRETQGCEGMGMYRGRKPDQGKHGMSREKSGRVRMSNGSKPGHGTVKD